MRLKRLAIVGSQCDVGHRERLCRFDAMETGALFNCREDCPAGDLGRAARYRGRPPASGHSGKQKACPEAQPARLRSPAHR